MAELFDIEMDGFGNGLVRKESPTGLYRWASDYDALNAQNSRLRGAIEDYLDGESQGNVTGLRQALEAAQAPDEGRDFWMNVYPNGHFVMWPTKEVAEEHYQTGRVACVHLRMFKGQFIPYTFMPECQVLEAAREGDDHGQ
ncbi:MAG TPA: hypothetical protein VN879_15975 [Candidatus Acidoferrales bacterium]|nr:hypothetical protein [Candidatus Acidoferrales bacterium]